MGRWAPNRRHRQQGPDRASLDLTDHTPLGQPLTGHVDEVLSVALATLDERPIAVTGSKDRTVRVWDLTDHTPVGQPLTGHTDWVTAVAVATLNGRPIAVTGSWDQTVRRPGHRLLPGMADGSVVVVQVGSPVLVVALVPPRSLVAATEVGLLVIDLAEPQRR